MWLMKSGKCLSELTKPELEDLLLRCNFTKDEEIVFRYMAKGFATKQTALENNMSERTVLRRLDKIMAKIEKIRECVEMKKDMPISEKYNLTLDEAAAYFNIGTDRLRIILDENKAELVLMVGAKRLIKRKKMEEYLDRAMVL